jgi:hypothetical protein
MRTGGLKSIGLAAALICGAATYSPVTAQVVESPCPGELASASLDARVRYVACLAGSTAAGEVLARSIGLEVATAPFGSTSGGFTFTFDPVLRTFLRSASTFGPAFSERATTSGRGRFSGGANLLRRSYDSIAGQDLQDLEVARLRGTDAPAETTRLNVDVVSETVAVFGHVGITNNFDVGAAVPFVRLRLSGLSRAFLPGGGELGTESVHAESSGVSDIAVVGKYQFWKSVSTAGGPLTSGLAALVTARFPTGEEENLRGLGITRTMLSLVGSGVIGRVSPHFNIGYELWSDGIEIPSDFLANTTVTAKDQIVYSGGVEVDVHPLLTANVDVLGRYIRGGGKIEARELQYDPRTNPLAAEFGIQSATVLVARGGVNTVSLAPGLKWNLWQGALLSLHSLITMTSGGLTDRITPVVGLDWAFDLPSRP